MPEAGNAGVRCPQAAPGSAGCRVRRKLGGGAMEMSALPNIVLVHGAWAHGSSWSAVIERLQADGYQVTAPQFPLTSLADNVARLRQVLARQNGPTVVAGHSYGGQIITALGTDGDQALPTDAERLFTNRMGATTVEVSTNHVAMVSHPDEVVNLIRTAAEAVSVAT